MAQHSFMLQCYVSMYPGKKDENPEKGAYVGWQVGQGQELSQALAGVHQAAVEAVQVHQGFMVLAPAQHLPPAEHLFTLDLTA